jgi:hypothetical protein
MFGFNSFLSADEVNLRCKLLQRGASFFNVIHKTRKVIRELNNVVNLNSRRKRKSAGIGEITIKRVNID